ncbi:MAG: MBL fold metallo-hydrolase [Desulfobacterales bacterium]|jgi:7,8-dihydropterin-6-yl-methyl-4-(beta-D-ribofuranosyl)aminobenzene 5'-phosphate synthase|nr:MBL fold metallo-hydrolase [Desulfobacterales bacterium]
MTIQLREVDQVEVLTLQDNYIDIAAHDGTAVVQRPASADASGRRVSILAEHGFSAVVSLEVEGRTRRALFDFGFSPQGAWQNARTLGVNLAEIEAMVLSHGHMDHHGGLPAFAETLGRRGVELVLHPAALRGARYIKLSEERRLQLPALDRERIEAAGVRVVPSPTPHPLLDGALLFLGEIPRRTDFEKGLLKARYEEGGAEKFDPIEDDSAVVAHVRGKGLVVLSGCAHAGIVNTVAYAREVTGVEPIFVVMGGFHLTGEDFEPIIGDTTEALKAFDPRHIVPTHCTGRRASVHIEREMPDRFLLNMSGTKMVFAA